MTERKQHSIKSGAKPNKFHHTKKFNRTPKKTDSKAPAHIKQSSSRPKGKGKGKSNPAQKAEAAVPVNQYLCKSCERQVVKKHPCGKTKTSQHGLGRFKCACGNKTVYVKKIKAENAERKELKIAA